VRDALSRVLFTIALGCSAAAADWPQFLGPSRNGVYRGPLAASLPSGGPRTVWRKSIGQGLAGPVVSAGRLILFHRVGKQEVVEAFDARTGSAQWRYAYPTAYRDDFGFDEGPRSVPVVANGRVYTFGAEGQLHAIDLATGRKIWSEDTAARFRVRKGFFGADRHILSAVVGLRRDTLRAGSQLANNPTETRPAAAATSVTGSRASTPNRSAAMNLAVQRLKATPVAAPIRISVAARPSTSRTTPRGLAPSAMRTAISARRRPTEYAVTP
jgi:hypothetical protein